MKSKEDIPKECKGCNSYKLRCFSYLSQNRQQWNIFKDRFCPCKKCIVKVTCKDPKYTSHYPIGDYLVYKRCCREFKLAIEDFNEFCEKNVLRTTRLKIKK